MKKIKLDKLMAIFMSLLLMFSIVAITPMSVFAYEDEDAEKSYDELETDAPLYEMPAVYSISIMRWDGTMWAPMPDEIRPGEGFWVQASVLNPNGDMIAFAEDVNITANDFGDSILPGADFLWWLSVEFAQASRAFTMTASCGTEHGLMYSFTVEVAPAAPTYVDFMVEFERVSAWQRLVLSLPTIVRFNILDEDWNHIFGETPDYVTVSVAGSSIANVNWDYLALMQRWGGLVGFQVRYNLVSGTTIAVYIDGILFGYVTID